MAKWWGREVDKLDPKLEGKSQEDILKLMKDAEDSKAEVERLKARDSERDTAVQNLNNNFNTIRAKLDSIEANPGRQPATTTTEEPADFVTDPDKAFADRSKPLTQLTVNTAQATAKILATQNLDNRDMGSNGKYHDGRLFRYWEAEILERAKGYQATALCLPQTWIDIYLIVKGLHSDELADPEQRKKNYSFMESGSSPASNTSAEDKRKQEDTLSPLEIETAKKMNVKPEDYLKRKKAMTFVGA